MKKPFDRELLRVHMMQVHDLNIPKKAPLSDAELLVMEEENIAIIEQNLASAQTFSESCTEEIAQAEKTLSNFMASDFVIDLSEEAKKEMQLQAQREKAQ